MRRSSVASALEAGTWPLATRSTFSRLCGIPKEGRDQFPARPHELTLGERVHGEPRQPASERLGHLGERIVPRGSREHEPAGTTVAIELRLDGFEDNGRPLVVHADSPGSGHEESGFGSYGLTRRRIVEVECNRENAPGNHP